VSCSHFVDLGGECDFHCMGEVMPNSIVRNLVFCCYINVLVFSGALIVLVFGSLYVIGSGSLQSCKGKYSASGSVRRLAE
jgi:hypothetical protein